VVAAIIGATAAGAPRAATADPVTDLTAQATAIAEQITANNEQITVLGQRYDAAELRRQQAEAAVAHDETTIAVDRDQLRRLRAQLDGLAASEYRAELAGVSLAFLDAPGVEQLGAAQRYGADQAKPADQRVERLSVDVRVLQRAEDANAQAGDDAVSETRTLTQLTAQLRAANLTREQTLSGVQGRLLALVTDQLSQQGEAELVAALAQYAPGLLDGGDPGAFPNLPAVSPAAAVAIAFARAQIGKPYVYAAAGPGAFDCSGLVMAAFASAGVRLPHYSGAQYALLPPVPLAAVQPGDLLFWGPGGSEHVAIYVGAGRILEAGGTGHDVHVGPIWGRPVGAARVV